MRTLFGAVYPPTEVRDAPLKSAKCRNQCTIAAYAPALSRVDIIMPVYGTAMRIHGNNLLQRVHRKAHVVKNIRHRYHPHVLIRGTLMVCGPTP